MCVRIVCKYVIYVIFFQIILIGIWAKLESYDIWGYKYDCHDIKFLFLLLGRDKDRRKYLLQNKYFTHVREITKKLRTS